MAYQEDQQTEAVTDRRSQEWKDNELLWRRLLHSYEGGDVYRRAVYGIDSRRMPIQNLIRHKREYPDPREERGVLPFGVFSSGFRPPSTDPSTYATDDDFQLRLARTPVPTFVSEYVETYMGKIFGGEVDRDVPAGSPFDMLKEWWEDVDGLGTSIDDWVHDTVGPLLLVEGCLDLCFDHPPVPEGEVINSDADVARLGISRCVASYILPENVVWWELDALGTAYNECLVKEVDDRGKCQYRHWTKTGSTLYDDENEVISTTPHDFGVVPIVRVFDRRRPGCCHVGKPRFEAVAERMREFYNRDSELILSDTLQAFPLLQGPDDYALPDGNIPIGPGWMLPMKKNPIGASVPYQEFKVLDFPKGAADSIRKNMQDIRDAADRDAKITKPAGAAGTSKGTVGQSGVSKMIDLDEQHAVLTSVAKVLAKAEFAAARMALTVLTDGKPPKDVSGIEVTYPTVFGLHSAEELAAISENFQLILGNAGECPDTEAKLLVALAKKGLQGYSDEEYDAIEQEIADAVGRKAEQKAQAAEGLAAMAAAPPDATPTAPGVTTNDPTVVSATPIGSKSKQMMANAVYS